MTRDEIYQQLAILKCDSDKCMKDDVKTLFYFDIGQTDISNEFSLVIHDHVCCNSFKVRLENKYKELINHPSA